MKKVIVTGAAGFIPSHLVEGLLNKGYEVLGFDNYLTGIPLNLSRAKDHDLFSFIEADVNNLLEIEEAFLDFCPDYVFHYAACVGVKRTLANPQWVLNDIKGLDNILELCRKSKVNRICYSSSSEVYGEPVEFPQHEHTTPLNSKLPYAVVKNLGEVYLKTYKKEYDLDYTIFRFFNTYGPRQSHDFVISKFIKLALAGEPISVYGDGSQSRTFCYIKDNIDATINALESKKCLNEVINIGSDNEMSILELAQKIIEVTNSSSKITYLPALEEGDMTRRLPFTEKMQSLIERELTDFQTGLRHTLDYFDSNV